MALLLVLAALATPAFAQTTVPKFWSLTPTGLTGGDQFRLLFFSSTKRDGSVTDIATYNTFIQNLAAAGHTDVQAYSSGFKVVGCTADADARDNTSTTYTSTAKGVPIYWLDGTKAADDYEDFYDGSWDDEANDKNESGTNGPDTSVEANYPITGCKHDGTEFVSSISSRSFALGSSDGPVIGRPNSSTTSHGPISTVSGNTSVTVGPTDSRPMYGLSVVFQVPPNTPPDAADGTVTTNEDTAYAFSAADFNFSDADGDAFEVEIVELPVAGTLKLDNANASVADFVSEADIDAGLFTYTPPANANGTGYASFDFAVDDGTLGSPAYMMTINVTAVNDLPSGKPVITGTATVGQALSASASGISDVDGLSGVTYSYQWVRVDGSDSDISGATSSTYTLQSADGGKKVKVKVSFTDQGSTTETVTSDAYPSSGTIGTTNTAPTATDSTVTTAEDSAYTFSAADFNFMDTDPTDTLSSVQIVTLPASGKGTLRLSSTAVTASQVILAATIPSLTYTPPANANSASYASFTFKVNDGTDDSAAASTMTINVTAVNDPPSGKPTITGTATVGQDLTASTSGISDADGLIGVTYSYQWLLVDGSDNNISGATSSTYTLQTADNGKKVKVKVSFTDQGSTAETLTSDEYPSSGTIGTPNARPTAADGTVTTNEDTAYTFSAANFNFSDTDGDTLSSVQIVTLPASGKGTLALSGTAVTASQVIPATSIPSLTYTPPANANGTPYTTFTFRVSDGKDESAAASTMTINVTAVNDPPSGKPTISGTAAVGQDLSASTSGISDVDGLIGVTYLYQWILVDGGDSDISGATSSTYTLQPADDDKKVKVSFRDQGGTDETVTSEEYPSSGTIGALNTVPDAPVLSATAGGSTRINLFWTAPGSDGGSAITGYQIEVSSDGSSFTTLVANTRITTTAYTHIGLGGGATRYYRVSAINTNGTGLPSNIADATTTAGQTGKTMVWFGTEAYTATEGGADAQVSVHLSEAVIGEPLDVRLLLEYGGGAAAADHGSIPTVVTFGVGQRTKTITVAATDDVLDDDGESVSLGFFNDHRDRVITGHGSITATVALEDNDGNERVDVSFGAGAYKATEGGTDATVEVNLDAAPGRSVEIPLVVTRQGGASAADYSSIPASVTFGAEETSKTVDVTATVDVGGDGGESVRLEFGELPASVFAGSPAAAVVTLFDSNTHQVGFVVSFGTAQTVLVRESSTVRHRFGVYLGTRWQPGSGRPSKPVTIPLVVTRRGATEDDHTEIPASVTFGVNEGASGFSMRAIPDQTTEPDEELTITFGQPLPPGVRLPAEGRCCRMLEVELVDLDVDNAPATGAPTISGTPAAGETLTADVSGISDVDGLSGVTYSYQWIRVVNGSDIGIPGAALSTYTLQSADVGNKVKVRVSFTDGQGGDEMLTSDEYPSSGTINEEETSSVVVPDPPPFSPPVVENPPTEEVVENPPTEEVVENPPTEEVVENPPTEEVEEGCAVSDVTGDDRSLEIFVECAAQRIEDSDTFTETLRILEGFRDDEGNWNNGFTYLVLLTARGGVYFHANNRDVEDLDWSGILSCEGEGSVLDTEEGCFIEYEEERRGYAHPLSASHVPLTRDEAEFVLLGGFNKIPEEGKPFTGMIGEPLTEAGEVDTDDRLRKFVGEAGRVLGEAVSDSGIDPAELRGILRREDGPWREGDVYIYILGETGRVIFNGADRDREQKNESAKQYVRDLIMEAGEGIVEYTEGGSFRRAYAVRVEVLDAVYFVGSGYRVEGQPGGSDSGGGGGGCAVGGSDKGGAFGLFLAALALLLAVSLKRRLADGPFWGNSR